MVGYNSVFEWDEPKNEVNYHKHGVDFPTATEVFQDFFAVETMDERTTFHGEERYLITGMSGGSLLTVVYTQRGDAIRLISARRASKHERNDYYRQNSQA